MKTRVDSTTTRWGGIVALLIAAVMTTMLPTAGASDGPPDRLMIEGRSQGEVTHPDLRLRDIARVYGGSQDQRSDLRRLVVGRAPAPGKDRCISDGTLQLKLKSAGYDPSQLSLNLPEQMCVSRRSAVFSGDVIRRRVIQFIEANAPWAREDMTIARIQVPDKIELPPGPVTCHVMPPSRGRYLGQVRLPILFRSRGQDIKKAWSSAEIRVSTNVVVTQRPLSRNRRIRNGDVAVVKKDLAGLADDVILDIDEVLGRSTTRSMDAYTVVRHHHIEEPLVIHRGDMVRIIAQAPGLRVSTMGEAKMKGRRGDRIRVMNIDTRQSVYAQVVDAQTVKVDF